MPNDREKYDELFEKQAIPFSYSSNRAVRTFYSKWSGIHEACCIARESGIYPFSREHYPGSRVGRGTEKESTGV